VSERPRTPQSGQPETPRSEQPDWVKKRRLAEIFGDVLPETTSDERGDGPDRPQSGDDWLKAQVPPHHGG
jgi:hypothetical protein